MKIKYLSIIVCSILTASSWAADNKNDLASFHKDVNGCKTCHTAPNNVSDSERFENKQCKSCHGDYGQLANPKLEIDPHSSH